MGTFPNAVFSVKFSTILCTLLDSEGEKLLNKPVGYTPDVEEYASFLECGLQAFISERKNASIFEIN